MANRIPANSKEIANALKGAELKINKSANLAAFVRKEGNLQIVMVWCSRAMSDLLVSAKTVNERLKIAQTKGAFFKVTNEETGEEFLRFELVGEAKWE